MIREIIWGEKGDGPLDGQFVEIFMDEEDGHLGIKCTSDGYSEVSHFLLKNNEDYEAFKIELAAVLECCTDMYQVIYELDEYLYNVFANKFLDDYPEYEPSQRTEEEIMEYMDEACDRVWLIRKQDVFCDALFGDALIHVDAIDPCLKAIDKVCEKYDIDFKEPVSDWEYGYWSGILAALRWVMGDEKNSLDT